MVQKENINRRRFLASAAATATVFTIVKPQQVKSYAANEKVSLGLIGCGGRGAWLAGLFQEHGGYEIVACADYFQDRVDDLGEVHNIPAASRYTTFSCHLRLCAEKLDAVAIITPPYFHPEQAAAAYAKLVELDPGLANELRGLIVNG